MKGIYMIDFFKHLYKNKMSEFTNELYHCLKNNGKQFIVTANPETLMIGEKDTGFSKLLLDNQTTIVADGIGVVKAAKILNFDVEERIPGVLITETLLKFADELHKSVFLFGSKDDVISKMSEVIEKKYSNIKLVGAMNGYVEDKNHVFELIAKEEPDIVLVALGIPLQEKLIYQNLYRFKHGIFIGIGGSFDVISGMKKRAPDFFIRNNIEWLYRIGKEPSRIKRFYQSNVKFILRIRQLRKEQ
ncbi:MAG: WecB/TagA/CpsF family glycosyltransferase [Bacilli bacterium]